MMAERSLLGSIERWNLVCGLLVVAGAALVRPRMPVVTGAALGAGLACINFHLLRRVVERISVARSKGLLVAVVFGKTLILLGTVWLILEALPVDVVAFTIGLSVFLLSIFVTAVRFAVAQAEQAS